ncbi:putative ATPase [Nonomuraea polychroma]|uniref:Putative ATPase n=1 Tax=Nonomuraea polychroma TaxID=46176 RepID=A0A438M776_9ACTN|nr:BTAD domain-containing putative transcriptional regulator [Nonomuraea polychroma]RVX41547.1 putative ATPase [Nonomuraea polychroma]
MVWIRVFGGVGAETDDGQPIDVGSGRTQALLGALAMSPGSPVPVTRLIELVWGDAPPRTAAKTLQWHVARLRKGLGHAAIRRVGAAYRLDVPPDAVDVARFRRHLREGDVGAALAEWTGIPLAGVDAPGLAATVDGLAEQWLGAVEDDLESSVDSDPHASIAALTELVGRHPLREGLWALLMTALARTGRRGDALAAYRQARHHLIEQLGIEPGPRLRELESLILREDERLREPDAPASAPGGQEGNLPRRLSPLIGRDDALRTIDDVIAGATVITLVGPGGIGKTRLALAAGRRVAADRGWRAWFVELAEINSSSDVPRAVAGTLGVAQRPGRSLTESVVTALGSRPALLIVDNCEHVLDGAARLVQAVALGCASVRVLVTSRERLDVDGEQVLVVGPLDPAAGAELFHVRALAADRSYERDAYRDDVAELCRRLDGVPLAIELAAARVRSHHPAELLARVHDHFRATGIRRTGAPRHRSLHAAIQWSYDLLTSPEQALLQCLSVFNGPFHLDAVAAVADDPARGLDEVDGVLSALVDRSMVTVEPGPFGSRFRLLEPMRQFAAVHLREQGRMDLVGERHARWCLREVTRVGELLTGPAEIEGVARLRELWPNLRAAVAWAGSAGDPRLAGALVRPVATELALRGQQEIGDWAERILDMVPPDEQDVRAFWLLWAAERYTQNGNPAGYDDLVNRGGQPDRPLSGYARAYAGGDGQALSRWLPAAVADLRRQGEPYVAAFLELNSAGTLLGIGHFGQVDRTVSAMADRYRSGGPPTLRHWALQTLAYSASFQGRPHHAERYFDEAATVDVPEGSLSANKAVQAQTAFRRGHRRRAFRILRTYIDELITTDNVIAASVVCIEFINMMAVLDHHDEAARMLAYLETRNDFGAMAARTLVVPAAGKVSSSPYGSRPPTSEHQISDRQALTYMGDVLDRLAADGLVSASPEAEKTVPESAGTTSILGE